ncbi:hypothetical protein M2459_003740 [Parabacteroides sp. PF5-5]|nr:hypothetical protein [Parabacteroides sp. PH5-39]MDH6317949.1 hypothetical protein [Parabacteroides sp. PF5-13]MDH6321698.1 hypothetical protein [Parabacteroides sp. PH5-13]MDH6325449.1 hypothetical protein [Parabacteroides sp. PH5-8]MDH6329160.1 hypothetical protein [Parabacteroides sp. PH5-41]MDH6336963.1 hypothetical protein [Parabacteroides sp. PF5-5]MDH6348029.1 hypothetical protein [Parabacteroides sp. PH5-46]MDH6362962.1 hypothetical protein [Parabacteroides sp. PH5-16]MDH6378631.
MLPLYYFSRYVNLSKNSSFLTLVFLERGCKGIITLRIFQILSQLFSKKMQPKKCCAYILLSIRENQRNNYKPFLEVHCKSGFERSEICKRTFVFTRESC